MSVNVTVYKNCVAEMLRDSEFQRRQELDRLRKQRLIQVRQQSNEMAKNIRHKVQAEKRRQEECLAHRKEQELKDWQRRNVEKLQREYEKCLKGVGSAHRAAKDYEEKENLAHAKRMAHRSAAAKRGAQAAERLRAAEAKKKRPTNLKQKTVSIQTETVESSDDEVVAVGTKTILSTDDEDEIKILSDMTESEEKKELEYDQPDYRSFYEGPFRQVSDLLQRRSKVDIPFSPDKYPILEKPRTITEKVKLGRLGKQERPQMAAPKLQSTTQRILTSKRPMIQKRPRTSRGTVAFEREAIRKDYDAMTVNLEKLTQEERKVKAYGTAEYNFSMNKIIEDIRKKQQNMEEAFEKLATQQSVITCPKIRSMEPEKSRPIPSINVGGILGKPQQNAQSDPELSRVVNIEKLKDLLEKINDQKKEILHEIDRTKRVPDLKGFNAAIENLQSEIHPKEDEKLAKKRHELERKEQKLHHLEKKIDTRMRELYEKTKAAKQSSETLDSTDSSDVHTVEANAPVKIVIKVSETKNKERISEKPGKVYPKTPKKIQPILKKTEPPPKENLNLVDVDQVHVNQKGSSRRSPEVSNGSAASTMYRSPPPRIKTEFTKFLDRMRAAPGMPQPKTLNPSLEQYIKKLLGMSRKEIDEMGVSTGTEIETPNSTIVNVPENQVSRITPEYVKRAEAFIKDNRKFVEEVNKKLETTELNGTQEQNVSIVEDVWLEILNKKQRDMERAKTRMQKTSSPKPQVRATQTSSRKIQTSSRPSAPPTQTSQSVQTSFKLPSPAERPPLQPQKSAPSPQTQIKSNINQIIGEVELLRVAGKNEDQILDKYTELTKTCSERIADLSKLIKQARVDKKMVLELSFTSDPPHSTEYLDIPQPKAADEDRTTPDTTSYQDAVPEAQIYSSEAMKQIGKSKDSGIGSRPLTSTEIRESTEQVNEEAVKAQAETLKKELQNFENCLNYLSVSMTNTVEKKKPPASIKRFSPTLPDKPTHELSTILELDASKASLKIPEIDLNFEKFPDFEEYLKALSQSLNLDLEDTQKLLGSIGNLNYEKYPSFVDDQEAQNKLDHILRDIDAEMKRREIIDKSFIGEPRSRSGSESSSNSILNIGREVAKTFDALKPELEMPRSPRKKQRFEERFVQRTPPREKVHKMPKTPTKSANKTPRNERPPPPRDLSPGGLSGIEELRDGNLAEEIERIGINWGASEVRRSAAANALVSSSSGQDDEDDLVRKCFRDLDVVPQPPQVPLKSLSLKQFLEKELPSRLTELTATENDSLSSQFLRSLLNMTSSASSSVSKDEKKLKQRTSTPVFTRTRSSTRPNSSVSSSTTKELFSGGSSISSVRGTSEDERQKLNKVTMLPPKVGDAEKYVSSSPSSNS